MKSIELEVSNCEISDYSLTDPESLIKDNDIDPKLKDETEAVDSDKNKDVEKIKFKYPRDYLKQKLDKLPRYTTYLEKEAILLPDDADNMKILKTLVPNLDDLKIDVLSEYEAMYMIFHLRKHSVSDLLEGIKECPRCGTVNDIKIDLEEIASLYDDCLNEENVRYEDLPIGIFTDLEEVVTEEVYDSLLVKDINYLTDKIRANSSHLLNFITTIQCRINSCREKIDILIVPKMIISKLSLSALYQEYQNLVFYGQFSKQDIDSMYPFERDVFTSLTKKAMENGGAATKALSGLGLG
jgi:phage FluMu protein Com